VLTNADTIRGQSQIREKATKGANLATDGGKIMSPPVFLCNSIHVSGQGHFAMI
jgi:hypothetical protein